MATRVTRWFLAIAVIVPLAAATWVWAQSSGRPFTTQLIGAAEVPPGDPDGAGTAEITVNLGSGQVCWTLTVTGITLPATAAHIHIAPAGIAGPIVVPLSPPDAGGSASGCREVTNADVLRGLLVAPELFYVNVHNSDFPGGALRGQLLRQP